MVKNLPTVERSTKIRFGKNCTDDQAENTIVFNASDEVIDASKTGSVYISPLNTLSDINDRSVTMLTYNTTTKEISDSGVVAADVIIFDLDDAAKNGNVTTTTLSFNNTVTAFTTSSNVGISNGAPIHTLDVGTKFYVDENDSNVLTVMGDAHIDGNLHVMGTITNINTENTTIKDAILEIGKDNVSSDTGIIMGHDGSNVAIGYRESVDEFVLGYTDSSASGAYIVPKTSESLDVHVYGRVLTESNVGILNTSPTHTLDVGSNLYVDEFGSNVLFVSGNTYIDSNLSVNKIITAESDLSVVENAYVSNNLTVTGGVFANSNLRVSEDATIVGNVSAQTATFEEVIITDTVDATSNSTGALRVAGGISTQSNLFVDGGNIIVRDTSDFDNQYTSHGPTITLDRDRNDADHLDHLGQILFTGRNIAGEKIDFARIAGATNMITDGDEKGAIEFSVIKDGTPMGALPLMRLSQNELGLLNDTRLRSNGYVAIENNLATTDIYPEVGALMVAGGIAGASNLNVGGLAKIWDATNSSSTSTGSLRVAGGVGISKKLYAQSANFGTVDNLDVTDTTDSTSVSTGAVKIAGGLGVTNNVHAARFIGDGSFLSNIASNLEQIVYNGNVTSGTVLFENPDTGLVATGNIQASRFIGDGSFLSNLASNLEEIITNGNVTSGTVLFENPDTGLVATGNIQASRFIGDGSFLSNLASNLEEIITNGNATSGTVLFENATTGIVTTSNIKVGGDISIDGLTENKIPIVGAGNFLEDSLIGRANGTIVISSDLEVLGNIVTVGNSYTVESNSLVINDRVIGIANNNVSHELDIGIIMQHPGKNVALIHHGEAQGDNDPHDHTFTIGYTQNTVTDNHIFDDSNIITVEILGNLLVQNNLTVSETIQAFKYLGDGGLLSNVNLQVISDHSNTTSNTLLLTNADTGLVATGNVEAARFIGDGSFLSNLASNLEEVVTNGNVTSNTLLLENTDTGLVATGNVVAARFIGDGSFLSNLASNLEEVVTNGNVTSNTLLLENTDVGLVATGNVVAARFIGDGSFLSNLASNLEEVVTNGNVTTLTPQFTNVTTGFVTTSNVGIANTSPINTLDVGSNLSVQELGSNVLTVRGNVHANKMTLGTITVVPSYGLQHVTAESNTTADTVNFINEDTGFVVSSNATIAGTLNLGNVAIVGSYGLDHVTDVNDSTTDTITSTHPTTGFVSDANVAVGRDVTVAGNVSVGNKLTVEGFRITGTAIRNLQQVTDFGNTTSNTIEILNNTESTDFETGALTIGNTLGATRGGLGVAGNVHVGKQLYVDNGLVTNMGGVTKKTYSFSNVMPSGAAPTTNVVFTSNVFYAKITATLVDKDEHVSTMLLDVNGGTNAGTFVSGTSNIITVGSLSIFGTTDSTVPWSSTVTTYSNVVSIIPSGNMTVNGNCHIFVEYMSPTSTGGVVSIDHDETSLVTFGY